MKVNGLMIEKTDSESIIIIVLMRSMKVNGKMVINTVKVLFVTLLVINTLANG